MKTLFIFGTRPEAIKMAPVIRELSNCPEFDVRVCLTAQHRKMLDQVLDFFNIRADYDLDIMKDDQDLFDITIGVLRGLKDVLSWGPDIVLVQGDTASTFVGALAGFYKGIRVAHIEAGLRSGEKYSPFPEEINRTLTGHIADIHFAPTPEAAMNLKKEGISKGVYMVGNTVIDALYWGLEMIGDRYAGQFNTKDRYVLVTGHRRESFGRPFEEMCMAIRDIALEYKIRFIYPVHLNPNVKKPVYDILGDVPNVSLIEPVDYPCMIYLMKHCYMVLTDSGGIQEEAPSFGKPVLVMRNVTERMEGVRAGVARLVGNNGENIKKHMRDLLDNQEEYDKMSRAVNPYGDGTASQKIREVLQGYI